MHVFEKNARMEFERQAGAAAHALGCDIAHIFALAAQQMRVLTESIEKGRADDPTDLIAAREAAQKDSD